jgi:hypothetical protein
MCAPYHVRVTIHRLNEAVVARQMDSLLVQTQSVGLSVFDAGDFGQHQRVLVGEGGWIRTLESVGATLEMRESTFFRAAGAGNPPRGE